MERKQAIEMILPGGKMPGYYEQLLKEIAEKTELFDRYKELLILSSPDETPLVLDVLTHYKVPAEPLEVLLLPDGRDALLKGALYEDYVIETAGGRAYIVLSDTVFFRLTEEGPEAEPAPALLQLQENIIVTVSENKFDWHAVDRNETEWAAKVAAAYRCSVVWYR